MIENFLQEFKNNICKTCQGACDKGASITRLNNIIQLKCMEYKNNNITSTITLKKKINNKGV